MNKFKNLVYMAQLAIRLFVLIAVITACSSAKGATWQPMVCPPTSVPGNLWGTTWNNVFAAGGTGTILHYDGDGDNDGIADDIWESVSSPTSAVLSGIWGSSADDIWIVGYDGTILRRQNGGDWQSIPGISSEISFHGIWGSGPDDVYAVGECRSFGTNNGIIWHWNGQSWTEIKRTVGPLGALQFNAIWGRGANEIFVVGHSGYSSGLQGVCYKYDGSQWCWQWSGTGWPQTRTFYGVWGTVDQLFIAGVKFGGPSEWCGEALHYDGSNWHTQIFSDSHALQSVWGSAQDNVYMVGYDGKILHYDGNTWSGMDSGTTEMLHGIWGDGQGHVFAGGGTNGTILHLYEPPIKAAVDIDPDTLNLNSKGKWITCYVELPEGYEVTDIDVGSILLLLDAEVIEVQHSDVQDDVLMVKFDRQDVIEYVEILGIEFPADVTLILTGELTDGTPFEGSDTIRVIDKGGKK